MPAALRLLAMADSTIFELEERRWCCMRRFTARVLLFSVLLAGFAINVNSLGASSSGQIPFISIEELTEVDIKATILKLLVL
jgi:hypothetical protein